MRIKKYRYIRAFVFAAISPMTFASNVESVSDSLKPGQCAQTENIQEKNMPSNPEQEAVIETVNHYLTGISSADVAQKNLEKAFYSSTNYIFWMRAGICSSNQETTLFPS